jgi:hypothetical protein
VKDIEIDRNKDAIVTNKVWDKFCKNIKYENRYFGAARRLATTYMQQDKVQTTPQLFGWLFYISMLSDSDKSEIIYEHKSMDRPLERYFNNIYLWALERRLASNL